MSAKADVKQWFGERAGEWAASYSHPAPRSLSARNLISRQRIAMEMVAVGLARTSRVLDAGCGTGEMTATLARCGYEVWGLDITETMIRHARERCGSDRFRVGDIEHLPFRDNAFDAVVCLGVVEYLDADIRALREVWRVLKPGGTAVISTPSAICPFYYMTRMLIGFMDAARPISHLVKYRLRGRRVPDRQVSPVVRHRKYYRRTWLRLLHSVGLEPEESVCHSLGWYRTWLGPVTPSRQAGLFRHVLEWLRSARVGRALDRVGRIRALNWLLAEQLVRVRAVK